MDGIADLRDESSARVGTRLVIELKNNATPSVVLNQLFKKTPLEISIGVNMVSLVDGVPRTLGVHRMLRHYLDHQIEVLQRKTQYRLGKAQAREHIIEGLLIAVNNIAEVVETIRTSEDTPHARERLIDAFELSEVQANAILDMPLRRITALEAGNLVGELEKLRGVIADLLDILAKPGRQRTIIRRKLREAKHKFGVPRRSVLVPDLGDLSIEDLIADDDLLVTVSRDGYVKSVPAEVYRTQGRGGRGVKAAQLKVGDVVSHLLSTTAHSYLLFFTNMGKVHRIRAHELPRQGRTSKGTLSHALLPLEPDERIEAIIDTTVCGDTIEYLAFFTRRGIVKKTKLEEYNSMYQTLRAIKLVDGDELVTVRPTSGENDLLIFTQQGKGLRFNESETRSMGRDTMGVLGIRLAGKDHVVGACTDRDGDEVLFVTSKGYGKRTKMRLFLPNADASKRSRHRAGKGIMAIKLTRPRGVLVGARAVTLDDEATLVSTKGNAIRTAVAAISRQARASTGVNIMRLENDETLTAFEVSAPTENTE